ncbi:MAG: hypothetical protein ABSB10_02820 [Candidatus Bathyarchaeia archaeon]
MLYAQLIYFETEEFHSTTATKVPDVQKLVEAGFEYVCDFNEIIEETAVTQSGKTCTRG